MEKIYSISEVAELQSKKQQLEQRLAIHKQKAEEKKAELSNLFAKYNVNSIEELSQLCTVTNEEMQAFAKTESKTIEAMMEACIALDKLL